MAGLGSHLRDDVQILLTGKFCSSPFLGWTSPCVERHHYLPSKEGEEDGSLGSHFLWILCKRQQDFPPGIFVESKSEWGKKPEGKERNQ